MKRILTTPGEIYKNRRVVYAGNHYICLPEINPIDLSIENLNIISTSNKGLVEIKGEEWLIKPLFFKDGHEIGIKEVKDRKLFYYIPEFNVILEDLSIVTAKIYCDLNEKGFIYEFLSTSNIEIKLLFNMKHLNLLRFNSHEINFEKKFKTDKWLNNPTLNISSNQVNFSVAFGGDNNFSYETDENFITLSLDCSGKNAFYITLNSDMDGASTTLIHFRRKGFKRIYSELSSFIEERIIHYSDDLRIETILNENLFFNYFFAIGKDMETDNYIALTSRSPRYYVSGAFWERDSFLWSFPALKLVNMELYQDISREMIIMHSKNPGDHAHYINGTVLYPGFELDEAASYFILLEGLNNVKDDLLEAFERVLKRIEKEYDSNTGLYKTFLLPSDDPSMYPFVTIDNVILWRGYKNLLKLYEKLNNTERVNFLTRRIRGIEEGIYNYLVKEINGNKIFVWSADFYGNYRLYNDPPGNLGLMHFYGFINKDDEIFKNTIEYYYSKQYKYYFKDSIIGELACDHHPNTPSGLGLCGSILNPIMKERALLWLKSATMDYGLLSESFDKDTGEAKTGVGFATGCGYLAFSLYYALIRSKK